MTKKKMPTLDNTREANINIKWLIQIVAAIVVAVWFYAELTNRLDKLEDQATINNIEIKQNSEFRIYWPRGTLGALPDDAAQNMRLDYLYLGVNELTVIPESICEIALNLTTLNVSRNNVCPPYPVCVEGFLGEQNTSECP